jgi:hypothetical protein
MLADLQEHSSNTFKKNTICTLFDKIHSAGLISPLFSYHHDIKKYNKFGEAQISLFWD